MEVSVGKRIFKGVAWLFGGLAAFAAVACLAVLAINWRDRPPSDAAQRLASLSRDRPRIPDAENGYVHVMRFEVSADPGYKVSRVPATQRLVNACASVATDCVAALETGETVMRDWIASEQWLLDRYLALLQSAGWVEAVPSDITAPLPSYSMVLDGQKLLLARTYLLAADKDAAAVQGLLGADVKFWRHVLASSDMLLTKMVAVAALNRHFEIGNLVLRRLPADLQMTGMPPQWTVQMTDEERSLLRTFAGEWIFGEHALDEAFAPQSDASFMDRLLGRAFEPLYKRQDTSNRRAEMFVRAAAAMNVPFDRLPQALDEARTAFDDPLADASYLDWSYNPIGKILVLTGSSGFGSYGARVADLEGTRRAAVLATGLRSRKVGVEHVAAELAASTIRAPYDGQPFAWDDVEQAIVFTGLVPRERGRHSFKY